MTQKYLVTQCKEHACTLTTSTVWISGSSQRKTIDVFIAIKIGTQSKPKLSISPKHEMVISSFTNRILNLFFYIITHFIVHYFYIFFPEFKNMNSPTSKLNEKWKDF